MVLLGTLRHEVSDVSYFEVQGNSRQCEVSEHRAQAGASSTVELPSAPIVVVIVVQERTHSRVGVCPVPYASDELVANTCVRHTRCSEQRPSY